MAEQEIKSIEQSAEQSVQARARGEHQTGFAGLLYNLAGGNYRISPWWSPKRDRDLGDFWKSSDHLSGALSQLVTKVVTIPVRVLPRDNSMKSHIVQAEEFTVILTEESEFAQGLTETLSKWLEDWWLTDNGGFLEIIGDGKKDGPIKGAAHGVAHLDSQRCQRTGDPEFPVLYTTAGGSRHKLYRTRVAYASDMPSAREEMMGVGFCAGSRSMNSAQNLLDISTYKQEKLGSRPMRAILQGRGIKTDAIMDALDISNETMDSRGFTIFSQLAVLGDLAPDAFLDLLDLVSLPDGFNEEVSTRLGMFVIALAFNVPIRWLWPASAAGATKADAMFQHIAGLGGGVAKALKTLTFLLGGDPRANKHLSGKFLPSHLKLVFDFQDDEQDRARAQIAKERAQTWKINLESGVINDRISHEQALEAGDLTQAQFNRIELEAGRLPNSTPIISLFHNTKAPFIHLLDLGVPNPLSISANDPIDMLVEINAAAITVQDVIANSSSATTSLKAAQALAALDSLKQMYAPMAQQAIQRDLFADLGAPPDTSQESPTEEPTEEGEKGFNFGVGVGEIIGGRLARGEGGQFVNAQEMMDRIRSGMLDRMRGQDTATSMNSAAGKRAANLAAVAESLGIDVNALALMKTGQATSEQEAAMVAMGLASPNPDGSVSMTTEGRGLLSAANAGDVDKAEQLKAKASAPKPDKAGKPKGEKPKQSPEDRRREREERQEAERAENRQEVAEGLEGRLDQTAFDALASFAEGAEPNSSQAQQLAQAGLVEVDSAGNARMTTAGKRVMTAANKGDLRAAKDALSQGKDRVNNQLAKADAARVRANEISEAVPEMEKRANERSVALNDQANLMDTRAGTFDARADSLDAEADAMQDLIDNPPSPEALADAQARQTAFREQAKEQREQATLSREQANSAREASSQILVDAQKRAEEAQARIDELMAQADELEDSVGGAQAEKGLVRRLVHYVQKAVGLPVTPSGRPLQPLGDSIEISEKEQDEAIEGWNVMLPEMAKGILEAGLATEQELEEAVESET